jgi:lipopolysaccharide biosynthesis glycosyltransferase
VTLAIGETYERLAKLTHPYFRAYATRHNLAFLPIKRPHLQAAPHFQKLACYDVLVEHERVIFVDTDVLIAPDAPCLLDIVPPRKFGAYIVSEHTSFHDQAILLIQQRLRDLSWQHEYFNSGVMVASREHRSIFAPSDPDLQTWMALCSKLSEKQTFSDQTYLNFKVRESGIQVLDIGYKFNHSLGPGRSSERFGSHFIHCKGHRRGTKEAEITRAEYVLSRPRLRAILAKFPFLTRLYDQFF